MLLLRENQREREISADALVSGVTNGQIPIEAEVQLENGRLQVVSLWYLEHSEIRQPAEDKEDQFVASWRVDRISKDNVLVALGLDDEAAVLDRAISLAQSTVIQQPSWAHRFFQTSAEDDAIALPAFEPDSTNAIVEQVRLPNNFIETPSWGRPLRLPVVDSLTIPPWQDPTQAGVLLPPVRDMVWAFEDGAVAAGQDAIVELVGQSQRAPEPAPRQMRTAPAPTRAEKRRSLRKKRIGLKPSRRDKISSQPTHPNTGADVDRPVREATRAEKISREVQEVEESAPVVALEDAATAARLRPLPSANAGITTETTWGLFGCAGRLVALIMLVTFGWIIQETIVRDITKRLRALGAMETESAAPEQSKKLRSPLIAEGPPDALLNVVIATDFADPDGLAVATAMLAELTHHPLSAGIPRLTILPLPSASPRSEALARSLVAADASGCFWSWLRLRAVQGRYKAGKAAKAGEPDAALDQASLVKELKAAGCDLDKHRDMLADPANQLRTRTLATMAAALQLDHERCVWVNHVSISATVALDQRALRAALKRAAATTSRVAQAHGGDRDKTLAALVKKMPASVRDRFFKWVARGERLPTTPVQAPAKPPVTERPAALALQLDESVPRLGSSSAEVTLVVFCDYRSPHCAKYARTLNQLLEAKPTEVQIRWIQYPMKRHKTARTAALSVIAAQQQGRFLVAHKWLLRRVDKPWTEAALLRHLQRTRVKGLGRFSRAQFKRDLVQARQILKQHRDWAAEAHLDGTPFTLINGHVVRGAPKLRSLIKAVERATARPPAGKLKIP